MPSNDPKSRNLMPLRIDSVLPISQFRFSFSCLSDVWLHECPGITLNGALKSVMRSVTCSQRPKCNGQCTHPGSCIYGPLLQTKDESGENDRGEDLPRPYAIHMENPSKSQYVRGDVLTFDLTLFGNARNYTNDLIRGLELLEKSGLGDHRGPESGRVRFTGAEQVVDDEDE